MPDIYINTERPVDRSIVAGINQAQREAPIGAFVAGSSYNVNLYFVLNDGTYDPDAAGVDVQVAVSTIASAQSGTFTLTDGTDTTAALEYGASAQTVEDALNALNSGTGLSLGTVSLVDVVKVNNDQYTWTARTFGAMTALSAATVSLYPESTPTASIAVAGTSTVYAQQIIEITRQPAVFQQTWSTITNGYNGTLAMNTTRLLQSLQVDKGEPFYIEVKLDGEIVAREVVGMELSNMPASAFTGATIALKSTEGANVLSTGEAGGTKFLREDGDGTSSWQEITKSTVGLSSVDNTADADKPVSTAQQAAIDLKANLSPVNSVMDKAYSLWLMNEPSGNGHDVKGNTHLTDTNTVSGAVADSDFYLSRHNADSTSEQLVGAAIALNSDPFAFGIGLRVDTTGSASRAICGQTDTGTNEIQWMLRRISTTAFEFGIQREGGSVANDTVRVTGLVAGTAYNIVCRFDGSNIWLHVSDLGDAFADASFGLWETDQPIRLGYAHQSATIITNHFDGDIGWAALWKGHLTDSEVRTVLGIKSTDLELEARRFLGLQGWGDSLTTAAHADPSWLNRVATDAGIGRLAEMQGIGGENSDGTLARMTSMPPMNLQRDVVFIWSGNNNATDTAQVISDVTAMRQLAEDGNAGEIIILGLPNRSGFNSTEATVDTLQAFLDTINTALLALAALHSNTQFLDVHNLFVNPANYTPIDADDIADQTLGIVPRSARDTPASSSSTHLGDVGAQHLADAVTPLI